jgi:hypothetical protein
MVGLECRLRAGSPYEASGERPLLQTSNDRFYEDSFVKRFLFESERLGLHGGTCV